MKAIRIEESEFKLERVGLPTPFHNSRYPWKQMKVGDSFFIPIYKDTIRCQAAVAGRKLGVKFSCRQKNGGIRVYRIK